MPWGVELLEHVVRHRHDVPSLPGELWHQIRPLGFLLSTDDGTCVESREDRLGVGTGLQDITESVQGSGKRKPAHHSQFAGLVVLPGLTGQVDLPSGISAQGDRHEFTVAREDEVNELHRRVCAAPPRGDLYGVLHSALHAPFA
jgi:hypothetical protein